jgi:hypothetical protein
VTAVCGNGCSECLTLLRDVNEITPVRSTYCRIWVEVDIRGAPTMWLRICELREVLPGERRTFRINEIPFTCAL